MGKLYHFKNIEAKENTLPFGGVFSEK